MLALEFALGVQVSSSDQRSYLSAGIAVLTAVTVAAAYVVMALLEEPPSPTESLKSD